MDMKLNNLLISQDHRLVIADFGAGISIDQNCRAAVGSISGNLEHRCPEIQEIISQHPNMHDEAKVSIDFTPQFSWEAGTILFELCCNRFPFESYPMVATSPSRSDLNLNEIPYRFHEVISGLLTGHPRMSLEEASQLIHRI